MAWIQVYSWGPEHFTQKQIDQYGMVGATPSPEFIYLHGFDDLYLAEQLVLLANLGIAYGVRTNYAFDWVPPAQTSGGNSVATTNSFNSVTRENKSILITDGQQNVGYHPITGLQPILPQAYGQLYETKIYIAPKVRTEAPRAKAPDEMAPKVFGVHAYETIRLQAGDFQMYSTGECFAEEAASSPQDGASRWRNSLNARWDPSTSAIATITPDERTAELLLSRFQVPIPRGANVAGIRVKVYGGRKPSQQALPAEIPPDPDFIDVTRMFNGGNTGESYVTAWNETDEWWEESGGGVQKWIRLEVADNAFGRNPLLDNRYNIIIEFDSPVATTVYIDYELPGAYVVGSGSDSIPQGISEVEKDITDSELSPTGLDFLDIYSDDIVYIKSITLVAATQAAWS